MEKKIFKHNKIPIDLIAHCIEQRVTHSDLKVFVGTDSISLGGNIHYFSVVAFRYGKQGVHFVYTKETVPSFRKVDGKPDVFLKLWKECELSMALAEYLVEKNVFTRDDIIIELDYNNIAETLSKPLIPATKGWATSAGYQCLAKIPYNRNYPVKSDIGDMVKVGNDWTDVQIACKAANYLCQGV